MKPVLFLRLKATNMATQIFYLEGKVNWAKVQEPVLKYGSKTDYEYTIDFLPNSEALAQLKASGSRLGVKSTPDGAVVKLRRGTSYTNKKNEIVNLDAPTVLKYNESTGENDPYDGLIGNGSDAIVKIAVYDTQMGKGTRLEGLVVLNLIEFEGGAAGPITSMDGDTVLPF